MRKQNTKIDRSANDGNNNADRRDPADKELQC